MSEYTYHRREPTYAYTSEHLPVQSNQVAPIASLSICLLKRFSARTELETVRIMIESTNQVVFEKLCPTIAVGSTMTATNVRRTSCPEL